MIRQLARVIVAIGAGWLGWIITPLALAQWTHGHEFVGLTLQERYEWIVNPRWLGLMSVAMLVVYAVNAMILSRVNTWSVAGWSVLMGCYVSSLVHFEWLELLEGPLPPLLEATFGSIARLALVVVIPTLVALAVRRLQPSPAEAKSMGVP